MTWVRLEEEFTDHPKVVEAGPLAGWLHIKAISYCNRYLTDGRVPRAVARSLVSWDDVSPLRDPYTTDSLTSEQVNEHLIQRLVAAGMWIVRDNAYQIHDYLKFQPSKAKVLAEREAERLRKAAGRAKQNRDANGQVMSNVPPGVPPGQTAVSRECPTGSDPDPVSERSEEAIAPPTAARPRFDFDSLYRLYPRKKGKSAGLAKLKALVRTEAEFQAVKHGLECFIRDEKRKGTEPEFYPYFSTWVSEQRWNDYTEESPSLFSAAALSPAQQLAAEAKKRREAEFEGQP